MVIYAKLDFLGEIKEAIERVGDQVRARMAEFRAAGGDCKSLFSELCYCILTANYTAEGGMRIQREIGEGFTALPRDALAVRLRELRYRFPNTRAGYIVEARCLCGSLLDTLSGFPSQTAARDWLAENVKGYGYKEASHFLRNVGFTDVAIIDRHILRFLAGKGLIDDPKKPLSRSRYVLYEMILTAIASKLGLTLAELDLYLWYIMTGKVLK
jgi:N-glycosylase/DNA lyase